VLGWLAKLRLWGCRVYGIMRGIDRVLVYVGAIGVRS